MSRTKKLSGPVGLSQTSPIPRSPDGDKKTGGGQRILDRNQKGTERTKTKPIVKEWMGLERLNWRIGVENYPIRTIIAF